MSSSMLNEVPMSVYVSSELNRQMVNVSQEVAIRAVKECGKMYNFDGEEAVRLLGLETLKLSRVKSKTVSVVKEKIVKASFPLPFNGENNEIYCLALRQNNGLYTQCQIARKGSGKYCKSCNALAEKSSDGIPEYGTIEQRMAVDIFEYVDPKGRKPVAYTKIMKKYKINKEQVLLEVNKLNLTIDAKHFEIQEEVVKRGRPAAEKKEAKEPKGAKGRPKKEKKVLAIEGEGEDLFANLVANAQEGEDTFISNKVVGLTKEEVIENNLPANTEDDDDDDMSHHTVKIDDEEEDVFEVSEKVLAKEQEKALKAQEKAQAAQVKEQEKALKAQEKALAVQAKEQKIIADKIAKEQKLALAAAEKEQKLALAAKAKEEKFGPLRAAAEKEKKLALVAAKKEPKVVAKKVVEEDEEEPDVVKKIEVDGKKYLKSKKSGIIYDYNEYVKNSEQVVVGKWNETKNKVDFTKVAESDEESEDEIEDDEA